MKKGRVYWITGLPGSGKTTIGTALYYNLREQNDNIIILDGDVLKQFVGDTVGYRNEDRLSRARKYSNICKILSDQGMWVIICTVAMFDSIREWNRDNIDGYVEIFLDVPFDVLSKRNKKGLYSEDGNKELFINLELPKYPDLVINNDYKHIDSYIESILKIMPRSESEYDRDKEYWNSIYLENKKNDEPSAFARSIIEELVTRKGNILELGCGNGRDSLYFVENGLKVTAIDASDTAIAKLKHKTKEKDVIFICDDFVKCEAVYQVMYESVYSRFTLHAISEKQENELLKNIKGALKSGGRIYIEARTVNDDLYGKGINVSRNAYIYNDHYRRFIDLEEFKKKLYDMDFDIITAVEDRGFSKTETSDPVLMRVIASKRNV